MTRPSLPAPRDPGRYRIALVCLGNICRSPMAHVVLADRVAAAGLDQVEVASSGTGDWHVGEPMDRRAAATLHGAGYDGSSHRAQQIAAPWLDDFDLLLAMDRQNLADIGTLAPAAGVDPDRVRLFGDFDPVSPGTEVPDPYFGGDEGFATVLAMVERTADALVGALIRSLPRGRP
ncbi:MAG TPA: low molecular weight protein-tyrosine-phosphatase [Nocardioides sp.]|nr:low molecular weight protein-tyrosine-phosphatase [Nocardioides sp.]